MLTELRKTATCQLLVEDPDLADALHPARRETAFQELVTECLRLPTGQWDATRDGDEDNSLAMIVLDGLVVRHVDIDGRCGVELLGESDVIRPWQGADAPTLAMTTGWSVLHPARVAVLDLHFATHFARYPEIATRLFERMLRRSGYLATNMAIVHQPRVDTRLHLLLWHLAGRWGRVRRDGVLVPLRLTHAMLADLVAARRPTVTSALSELSRKGLVRSSHDGWVLFGSAPAFLAQTGQAIEERAAPLVSAGGMRT
jgi:CRP/FNR family transcriptional regulator, cyclic AMP receptor protein